jgi:Flp pilus assembly protein TadD
LAGDPDHPDIAFNLAVSLDRLHRRAEAMAQYGRALALAEHRFAAFSTEAARRRLEQLAR